MNMSDALKSQVTGTADLGDGLVLEVVHIPRVTVCRLMATVELLTSPYASITDINHAMTLALREAIVARSGKAAAVSGTSITLTYNRDAAEWEIRGLPETEK